MAKKTAVKPPPVAVALLDTHWLIREALGFWLKEWMGYRVAWKGGTRAELGEALEEGLRVDLVLVAVATGEDEGHLAIKWLREEWPALHCAAYAHRHDPLTMLRVYRNRAQVVLHDAVEGNAVLCALNAVLAGGVFHTVESQQLLLENPDGLTQTERNRERLRSKLSPRQLEVLEVLVQFPHYTCEKLGSKLDIEKRTFEGHLSDLYDLFGERNRSGLLLATLRVGLFAV